MRLILHDSSSPAAQKSDLTTRLTINYQPSNQNATTSQNIIHTNQEETHPVYPKSSIICYLGINSYRNRTSSSSFYILRHSFFNSVVSNPPRLDKTSQSQTQFHLPILRISNYFTCHFKLQAPSPPSDLAPLSVENVGNISCPRLENH